jgi:hypothetical protein
MKSWNAHLLVRAGRRPVHVLVAEHLAADLHAALVRVVRHAATLSSRWLNTAAENVSGCSTFAR